MTDIVITTHDGDAEAWLARPAEGASQSPGVLLFMDAIGLRSQLKSMAERIADWGYVVLVPNVFYRSGTAEQTSPRNDLRVPGAREEFFKEAGPRINALTSDLSRPDTQTYLEYLTTLDGVDPDRIGVVGYCMGVRLGLRAAGDHPDTVRAMAGFHGGGLVVDDDDSPHRWISTAGASMLLRHADDDPSMTPDSMAVLERTAADAEVEFDQQVYRGAAHGYSMADTSMYGADHAETHFTEMKSHLDRHLRSRPAALGPILDALENVHRNLDGVISGTFLLQGHERLHIPGRPAAIHGFGQFVVGQI